MRWSIHCLGDGGGAERADVGHRCIAARETNWDSKLLVCNVVCHFHTREKFVIRANHLILCAAKYSNMNILSFLCVREICYLMKANYHIMCAVKYSNV